MGTDEKRRVYHVEIKATGEHRYFSSPAAIYANYSNEKLGIAKQSLLNYWQETNEKYENAKCVIRKGDLERNIKIYNHGKRI
jgi:hypothetical protein